MKLVPRIIYYKSKFGLVLNWPIIPRLCDFPYHNRAEAFKRAMEECHEAKQLALYYRNCVEFEDQERIKCFLWERAEYITCPSIYNWVPSEESIFDIGNLMWTIKDSDIWINGDVGSDALSGQWKQVVVIKLQTKPVIVERFADNGSHSHWALIGASGELLWSEEPDEEFLALNKIEKKQ